MNTCYIMFLEKGLDLRSENEISCVCLRGWGYYDIPFGILTIHWKCTSKFNVEKKEIEARVISRCNPMLPITRTSMGTFLFEDNTILTIPLELVELAPPNVE